MTGFSSSGAGGHAISAPRYLVKVFNADGELIYVGVTPYPGHQVTELQRDLDWSDMHRVYIQWFPNKATANEASAEAAKDLRPRNI